MDLTLNNTDQARYQDRTILIIDDEPANLKIISDYLEDIGLGMLVARNGESGLQKAQYTQPDLILLDVLMPGIDGFEVCRRLKAAPQTQNIPVIFMTALMESEYKIKGFAAGAVDYIAKPFQREEVWARVKMHLTLSAAQTQLAAHNEQLAQEITERKQAEEALRESEELYRLTLSSITDAIFLTDDTGAFKFVCPNSHIIFGYFAPEVWAMGHISKLLGAGLFEPAELARRGEIRNIEQSITDKAGKTHTLLVTVKQVVIKEGTRLYSCHDITELKQAQQALQKAHDELEQRVTERTNELNEANANLQTKIAQYAQVETALRASEARYRSLFENSPISLWEADFSLVKAYFNELRATGITDLRAYFQEQPQAVDNCLKLAKLLNINKTALALLGGIDKETFLVPPPSDVHPQETQEPALRMPFVLKLEETRETLLEVLLALDEGRQWVEVETALQTPTGEEKLIAAQVNLTPGYEKTMGKVLASVLDVTARKRLEEEIQRRSRNLTALNRAGQAISASLELDQVLITLLTEVCQLIKVEGCGVWLVEKSGELVCHQYLGPLGAAVRGCRLPPEQGLAAWLTRLDESLFTPDARGDELDDQGPNRPVRLSPPSTLNLPLRAKERVIGVLQIVDTRAGKLDKVELELLEPLATEAAIALENARLYQEITRRLAETNMLQEVMLAAASSLDLDIVLTRAIQAIARMLAVDFVGLMFPNETEEYLVAHSSFISAIPLTGETLRLPLSSACGRAYTTGWPVLINDVPEVDDCFTAVPGMASKLCVPVQADEPILAVLNIESARSGAFTNDDLRLLSAIAAQLSVVIRNARLYESEREQRQLLQDSQAQLVRSEKLAAAGRLTASLAHEINNPLQAIHNSLRLLRNVSLSPEETQEFLQMADEEVERLIGIVTRILEFARPSRGEKQLAQINAVIQKSLTLTQKYLQHQDIRLEQDLSPALPPVLAAPDELGQVFLNLFLNAVDAMPAGGTLRISSRLARDGRLAVSFVDSGHGISAEDLEHIFEPFFSTKEGSTGLGLSISLSVIERYGGEMTVQSAAGEGATFTVWLPASTAKGRRVKKAAPVAQS